jgi:hypothetical protein
VPEAGRRKSFESIDIAKCVRVESALMRAKPRCGHRLPFPKERYGQAPNYSFEAVGSDNSASQQLYIPDQTRLAAVACHC